MPYNNPASYNEFMGRWSRRLAPRFAAFAGISAAKHVLDVGCGTGILSQALLDLTPGIKVVGIDPAASYVEYARQSVPSARARFEIGAADALRFGDGAFDATLSLLVLQELPDAPEAVREMARVTRCGGTVATCKWDFRDGMPMLALFWQAAEAVAPEAVASRRAETAAQPAYDRIEDIAALWKDCGVCEIRTAVLEITLGFASFEDFWVPFLGGSTGVAAFARDLNDTTGGAVAKRLQGIVEAEYGMGAFLLAARAWSVAGIAAGSQDFTPAAF
jgi:ubiquinone/menaquinone biosynthesis C-methylase UbiE